MKYLRWLLIAVMTLYALMSAMPATLTLLHKLHLLRMPDIDKTHGALMDAMTWPQVLVWWAAIILFLVAAYRLGFGRGRAFVVYAVAYVLDVLGWLWMRGPAYDATFPPNQQQADLIILGVLAVIGALMAWVEMRKTPTN